MSNVFFPRVNRQNRNDALVQHKTKPCFLIPKEKEFHPHSPCEVCFPSTANLDKCAYEELGVRNLLAVAQPNSKGSIPWHNILQQHFKSLQVHWGQLEKLGQINAPKLYVVIHQSKFDVTVLAYTLLVGLQETNIEFLNQNYSNYFGVPNPASDKNQNGKASKVLFIDAEKSDLLLTAVGNSFCGRDQPDVLLIPTSLCYELSFGTISLHTSGLSELHSNWKPNVRINFGLPHSFKDFINNNKNKHNMIADLKQHMRHEIWRNTPIMSVHVLSMILQYRIKSKDFELQHCVQLMDEFQKKFRQHHDLAFVGDLDAITQYSFKVFSMKGVVPFSSVAVDVMKLESLMMKSLFSAIDVMEFDLHSDTCRVSQNRLLENFRKIARLLRHEIDLINPPCLSASAAEKKALDYLIDNLVLSQQSDEPNSGEQQMAKRIAYHLDVDSEDEEDWAHRPTIDTLFYVNIANALSHKWITTIASTVLDIYYVAAKQLLELRKIDVIEETVFLQRISDELKEKGHYLDTTAQNAIKLFKEEGIIESYSHSDTKILYLKDPFDETSILRLVHDIAQFY